MMSIKEIYNVVLVKLKIREVLPSKYINSRNCIDCKEKLVSLEGENIFNRSGEDLYGRESVVTKIKQIASILAAQGLAIIVYELYRRHDKQNKMRMEQKEVLQQQYPEYNEQQISIILNRRISSEGGGHQTGGAIDLTICTANGEALDMGTAYLEFNTSTPTNSSLLSTKQKENRALLVSVMKDAGFVNYPLEWWHYSYGDKMWAAYSNASTAIYGNVQ